MKEEHLNLSYFKQQEEKYEFINIHERIDNLQLLQKEADKRLEKFKNLSINQEIIVSTCQGVLSKMWTKLNFSEEFNFAPEYYNFILESIAKKIKFIKNNELFSEFDENKPISNRSSLLGVESTYLTSDFIQFN